MPKAFHVNMRGVVLHPVTTPAALVRAGAVIVIWVDELARRLIKFIHCVVIEDIDSNWFDVGCRLARPDDMSVKINMRFECGIAGVGFPKGQHLEQVGGAD